jgi:hypothetical protein
LPWSISTPPPSSSGAAIVATHRARTRIRGTPATADILIERLEG